MASAANTEPTRAASHGLTVKCRISSPLAMMRVCGSLRLPNTEACLFPDTDTPNRP